MAVVEAGHGRFAAAVREQARSPRRLPDRRGVARPRTVAGRFARCSAPTREQARAGRPADGSSIARHRADAHVLRRFARVASGAGGRRRAARGVRRARGGVHARRRRPRGAALQPAVAGGRRAAGRAGAPGPRGGAGPRRTSRRRGEDRGDRRVRRAARQTFRRSAPRARKSTSRGGACCAAPRRKTPHASSSGTGLPRRVAPARPRRLVQHADRAVLVVSGTP